MAVIGIYSFPKSGNTWIRSIVGSLFEDGIHSVPDLHKTSLDQGRSYKGCRFYKHHGGRLLKSWKGEELNTTHVIHIRRNPLDVFLSYLNFVSDNVTGNALLPFSNVEEIVGTDLFDIYFHSFVLTGHITPFRRISQGYFRHNTQWLKAEGQENTGVKIKCIKYEDLVASGEDALGFITAWLGLEPGQLGDMVRNARKDTTKDGKFFWKQREKNYLDYLSEEQIELFLKYRGDEASAIGYSREYLRSKP